VLSLKKHLLTVFKERQVPTDAAIRIWRCHPRASMEVEEMIEITVSGKMEYFKTDCHC